MSFGCGEGRLAASFDRSFDPADARRFELDNADGDLEVIGEDGRLDVAIHAELRTYRASEHRDEEAAEATVLDLRPIDTSAAHIVAGLHQPPPGYFLNVSVYVPAESFMIVDDDSGDVYIEGIGALELDDDSGDAAIRDIAGDVGVSDDSGDLSIRNVGGSVFVGDRSGDLHIDGVGGDVSINDRSGDIVVSHVSGLVTVDDRSGDIVISDAGDVRIDSDSSGDVVVK